MADRNARFRREIAETDKRAEQYSQRLEQLFTEWINPLLEAGDEAALAEIQAGNFPPELEDQITNILALYEAELRNIQGRFSILEEDVRLTEIIADLQAENVRGELITAATSIATAAAFGLASGEPISPSGIREQFTKGRFNRIETGIVTDAAAYRSGFEIKKAQDVTADEDEPPKFAYIGPRDDKNRDFCRFVLNQRKLWTIEEIRAELDTRPDAQLTPTFIYGGGYNCRHRWIFTRRR